MKIIKTLVLMAFSINVFSQKKVALVQLSADRLIGMNSMLGGLDTETVRHFKDLAKDPKFNVASILHRFHDSFWKEFAPQMPVDFYPESQLFKNSRYKGFVKNQVKNNPKGTKLLELAEKLEIHEYYNYPGYEMVLLDGADNNLVDSFLNSKVAKNTKESDKIIDIFNGEVDGTLYINLGFTLGSKGSLTGMVTSGMLNEGRMLAYIDISLYNKDNRKVFSFKEKAFSDQKFDKVLGIALNLKPEEILTYCESASDNLMKVLEEKLPKMTKKIDQKL